MGVDPSGQYAGWVCAGVVMVRESELSAVLSEFADTMVTDFPIQAILNGLVRRIVEILPVTRPVSR